MSDKKYEESIDYTSLLMLQINDVRLAIQLGKTASIELDNLLMLIPEIIINPIRPEIEKVYDALETQKNELRNAWSIISGNPSNHQFKIPMTSDRQAELVRLEQLSNQIILNKIINRLFEMEMLLTDAHKMPSSLVR